MTNNWDDLRIFLAAARGGSLSEAGRHLRMDPATVGRRIARLEDRIGAALFVKSPQGYVLTDAGMRLIDPAEAAERAMLDVQDLASGRDSDQHLQGQIRIGAPDGCANFLLPQVCTRIRNDHPDLDIQILSLPRVVNLSRREADVAISVSMPVSGRVTVQKLTDYHLSIAGHIAYLDRHGIASLADAMNHPIVGYIPDMIFDKELDYLGEAGGDRVALASNSVSVQLQALRQGAGVGIVHDFALPLAPELRRLPPSEFHLKRSFYLLRHTDDRRLPRMNRFAQLLGTYLADEVARLEKCLIAPADIDGPPAFP